MIVEFTIDAERDLLSIDDYIAADDPDQATRFVGELIHRCEQLADFSNRYATAFRRGRRTVRKMRFSNYLVSTLSTLSASRSTASFIRRETGSAS